MPDIPAFSIYIIVKKIISLFLIFLFIQNVVAIEISADLFTYDETKIEKQFEELNKLESFILNKLESFIKSNPSVLDSENPQGFISLSVPSNINLNSFCSITETAEPGKIPSFWFSFVLSAIGTYTLYGAVAGPISVGIVYFSSKRDKAEVKKAFWGCLTGTLVGAGMYVVLHR
jgi:hypothetical protein